MPRTSQSTTSSHRSSLPTPPTVFRNPASSVGHSIPNLAPPSLGQSIKEGFGLGAGSAIAQRVVTSIFGPPTVNTVVTNPAQRTNSQEPCDKERIAFESCMKTQSMETFCGQEQIAYTSCIRLSNST